MFLIIISVVLSLSFGFAQSCLPPLPLEDFKELVAQTQTYYFPELKNTKIIVTTFDSDAYFLQAQPSQKSLFKQAHKRTYEVQLNLRLLACPPDTTSLQAILVHELEHVKDYEGWTSAKILKHGANYILNRKFRTQYERATDIKTLKKGLSSGLKGYRFWVYQWLKPAELKKKQRYYFTPEEISQWQDEHEKF